MMDELLQDFLEETTENLETVETELVRFEREPDDAETLGNIFRLVHTVKGSCGFIGLPRLEAVAHCAETLLGKLRDGDLAVSAEAVTVTLEAIDQIRHLTQVLAETQSEPPGSDEALIARLEAVTNGDAVARSDAAAASEGEAPAEEAAPDASDSGSRPHQPSGASPPHQTIRVSIDLLEKLMTSVSELVLTRNQLIQEHRQSDLEGMALPLDRLSSQIARLHESVMQTRMQPISGAWAALPKMVRSLALDLGKKIELHTAGDETELDRQMLELIKDPLAHMVRNSADHGIETPEERLAGGKPETGRITLTASQEGGHITILMSDDGRGLNVEKLRKRAVESKMMTPSAASSAEISHLSRLIFTPGFSTADEVTTISGRGIGMDVVRANVERIGGSIEVESKEGEGTLFRLRIPLTLAIMPALIVGVAGTRFAVPQIAVAELVRAGDGRAHKIETIGGSPVLRLRGRLLPLVYLRQSLKLGDTPTGDNILVVKSGNSSFGVVVDELFDTEELVVKPISRALANLPLYSGNAVLGDGNVIMILDMSGLAANAITALQEPEERHAEKFAPAEAKDAILLFRACGAPHQRAVPLTLVSRIEHIEADSIEQLDGRVAVQLRGRLIPLKALKGDYRPITSGRQTALIFADTRDLVALAVDDILDIVHENVKFELDSTDPAKLGTAIIAGKATELIDVAHLMNGKREAEAAPEKPQPRRTSDARVLVVDDSPFFRNLLQPLLSSAGYDVSIVEGVDKALALREGGEQFDLILSDIEMPGKSGLDFVKEIRSGGTWSQVPMIALSSLADKRDVALGLNAGFDRYVAKFDRHQLLELLSSSLGERAA